LIKQLHARQKKIDQLREKALARIDKDAALHKHRFILIDYPLTLYDHTTLARFPRGRDEMDLYMTQLENHYSWVCSASSAEILRWTVARIPEFRDYLKGYINNRHILELIDSSDRVLRQQRITEATKYIREAFHQLLRYTLIFSDMKRQEPLKKTGKRVKNGQEESIRVRLRKRKLEWKRWQKYIDNLNAKRPYASFSWMITDAYKEFHISKRSLYKHVKKSW